MAPYQKKQKVTYGTQLNGSQFQQAAKESIVELAKNIFRSKYPLLHLHYPIQMEQLATEIFKPNSSTPFWFICENTVI